MRLDFERRAHVTEVIGIHGFHELSNREQQVARLAASGLSNKRIARALQVTDGTIKMHMHHILAKLQLSSRFDLARMAHGFAEAMEGQAMLVPDAVRPAEQTEAQIIPIRQY